VRARGGLTFAQVAVRIIRCEVNHISKGESKMSDPASDSAAIYAAMPFLEREYCEDCERDECECEVIDEK